MSQPSFGQAMNFLSVLGNNIDWSSLESQKIQELIDRPYDTGRAFTDFLEDVVNTQINKKRLRLVTTVPVGPIESFHSAKNFKENQDGSVWIWHLAENFNKRFGSKIETVSEAAEIKSYELIRSAYNTNVIAELGDTCDITLGQFFSLIQNQGQGQDGVLLTDSRFNFAYIRDYEDKLRVVLARWDAGVGWSVKALSVARQNEWAAGAQVLSR